MQADSDSNLRVFLRNSGEFYRKPDQWVPKAEQATVFETRGRALEERERIPKPKLELIVLDNREMPHFGLRLWKNGE